MKPKVRRLTTQRNNSRKDTKYTLDAMGRSRAYLHNFTKSIESLNSDRTNIFLELIRVEKNMMNIHQSEFMSQEEKNERLLCLGTKQRSLKDKLASISNKIESYESNRSWWAKIIKRGHR